MLSYVEEINIGGGKGQADLTAGQFAGVLNNGSYIVACGTPRSMHVNVCAAVQNGRAVGVTVTTDPAQRRDCGLHRFAHPRDELPLEPQARRRHHTVLEQGSPDDLGCRPCGCGLG